MQSFIRALKNRWDWLALVILMLVSRAYLLSVYDVELSNDGFDAVNLLTVLQTPGLAVSNEGITRLVLHPLYTILLYALRLITPASFDFYLVARLFSTLFAGVAILLLFEFARRAFGQIAAWSAALFLVFAPTFLWESITILSSALFLALYIAVWLALWQARYRLAAFLAFLSAITRTEGVVLVALVFILLCARDVRARKFRRGDWLVCLALALAVPLTIIGSSWLATGNPLQFIGAQSISTLWLRFMAPGDFWTRASFFITRYPALIPEPMVWLGVAGAISALIGHRIRGAVLLLLTAVLFLIFFEMLVWLNYTTLETRFLMYPGFALIVFSAVALADARQFAVRFSRLGANVALAALVVALCGLSYQQGDAGMRFVYNMHASQREVADELARIVPPHQPTNVMIYGGVAGALDFFAQQRGMQLELIYFRFAPDDQPEQYIVDHQIRFIVYPVGNAFAKAKYPYLARFETQTHNGVTFQPLTQFATSLDNQLYSIWAIARNERMSQSPNHRISIPPSANAARSRATFFPTDTFAGNRPSTLSMACPGRAPFTPMNACATRN